MSKGKEHVVVHAARWRYWFWGILIGGFTICLAGGILTSH